MKKTNFFVNEGITDESRQVMKSLNETQMIGFLFSEPESRLFEAPSPERTSLTGARDSKVGGAEDKKKIIRLVNDVQKVLSENEFKRTARLMATAKKKLTSEMNSSDSASVNLFSLAPAALDSIRAVCAAIELAEETTRTDGNEFRESEAVLSVGLDEEAVKKIINNGFKANPGFFKYLGSKLPFIGAIGRAIDNLKTKESVQHRRVDPFSHLPPLFEEMERDVILSEVTGLEIGSAVAGGAFLKAGYDYLKQLASGGSVSGKGSVAAYMSLFGSSEGIHKALYADLTNAGMTMGNVKAVSDAISASETKHLGIKPTPPKANVVSGLLSDPKDFSVEDALSGSDANPAKIREFASSLRLGGKDESGALVISWENKDVESKWEEFKQKNSTTATEVEDKVLTPLLKKITPAFMQMSGSDTGLAGKNYLKVQEFISKELSSANAEIEDTVKIPYENAVVGALMCVQIKWDPEKGYGPYMVKGMSEKYKDFLANMRDAITGTIDNNLDAVDFFKQKILKPSIEIKDPKDIFESRKLPDEKEVIIERWQRLAGIIK